MQASARIAAVVASVGSAALAENLVVNPGFESGVLSPFYQTTDNNGTEDWNVTGDGARSGLHCATDVGNESLRQDFAPIPVAEIREVSLWVKNNDDASARVNGIRFHYTDGSISNKPLIQPDNDWNYNNVTSMLLPGKTLCAITFSGYGGGGPSEDRSWTDDWVVRPIPGPASLALLVLAGAAPARRRW